MIAYGDKIFRVGGISSMPNQPLNIAQQVWMLKLKFEMNSVNGEWTCLRAREMKLWDPSRAKELIFPFSCEVPPAIQLWASPAWTVRGGQAYFFGGYNQSSVWQQDLYVFNLDHQSWAKYERAGCPRGRSRGSLGTYNSSHTGEKEMLTGFPKHSLPRRRSAPLWRRLGHRHGAH